MTTTDLGLLVTMVALVALLFVMAMAEASLLHLRRSAVAAAASQGDRRSQRLLDQLDDLPTVMNAVLLVVLLVQVTATTLAGVLAQRWFGGRGITMATLGATAILFIYGEAIPKTIAIADPVRVAHRFSPMITALTIATRPVVSTLVHIARWQSLGIHRSSSASIISEGELRHLTGEAAAAGQIQPSDADLIEKSFTLGDLTASDILIPIGDVVSVAASTPVAAALQTAIEVGHRRLIVHDGSLDQIIGFVRLRDLAHTVSNLEEATTSTHLRPALEVRDDSLVIDVLREMQRVRCHLAVVNDGNGVTLGIVTVEDIVEELLGDIDDPEPRPSPRPVRRRRE